MDTVETETPSLPSCEARCMRMTEQGLCDWCARRLERELADLPALYSTVAADLARGGTAGEKVSGSKEPPAPVRVDALSWIGPAAPGEVTDPHGDQTGAVPLVGTLSGWARLVAEERRVRPPLPTAVMLAEFLAVHAAWAAAQDWADDLAEEVHAQWRTGRRLAGITPAVYRLPTPCPSCGNTALIRQNGGDSVECEACGRIWRDHEYRLLVLGLAAGMKRGA